MSMNFAREQSLLRQKLQAKASPEVAAAKGQQLAGVTFLGAADSDVAAAATTLAATYPQMGRAQMTAFVRTLWNSKIHELRAVGALLLASRNTLLEPADLPLVETFLQDVADDSVKRALARDVVGAIVCKNKKLWKDLKRLADRESMRLAAVRAAALPLADDPEAFPRFIELVTPLLAVAEPALQAAIDDVLAGSASMHYDSAVEFARQHARPVTLSKPKPVAPPPPIAAAPAVTVAPKPKTPKAASAAKAPKAPKTPKAQPAAVTPAPAKPVRTKPAPKQRSAAKAPGSRTRS